MRLLLPLLCAWAWAAQQPIDVPLPGLGRRPAAPQSEVLLRPGSIGALFDAGKAACGAEDWRRCADSMMEVLFLNPHHIEARSYLQESVNALKKERAREIRRVREETRAAIGPGLEAGRIKAERWNALLAWAQAAGAEKRWLAAWDFYQRVLEENPLHGGALEGLRTARREIAARLDRKDFRSEKEARLYIAAHFYSLISPQDESSGRNARRAFLEALLSAQKPAELADEVIRHYVALLAKYRPEEAQAKAPAAGAKPPSDMRLILQRRAKQQFQLAARLRKDGRLQEAVSAFREVIELDPRYPGAEEGFFEASQALERRKQQLRKEAESLYQAGLAYYAAGDLEKARQEMGRAVQADPEHPYARNALEALRDRGAKRLLDLASRLKKDGRLAESIDAYDELLEMDPRYPGAKEGYLEATHALGRRDQERREEAESRYQAGLAYYATGDLARARGEMEKAVQADPNHSYARSALERLLRPESRAP